MSGKAYSFNRAAMRLTATRGLGAMLMALGCLGMAQAASFNVPANAANLTNVAVDGKCNLTEAILSVQSGPVNSDCVPTGGADRHVFPQGANTVFQLAAGTTIWGDMTIYTTFNGQVIEAAGTPIRTNDGCVLRLTATGTALTLRVKSGSTGRAMYAAGGVVASNIIFQGGNVTGLAGDTYGGVIYSTQGLTLTDCGIQGGTAVRGGGLYLRSGADLYKVTIQNNSATDAGGGIFLLDVTKTTDIQYSTIQNNTATKRGGGIYASGGLNLHDCTVKGNKAGQGGGIFNQWKDLQADQPTLVVERSTLSDNKAIASEVTPIPGPSGTVISGTGTQCSAGETPSQAFDESFGTKWCTTNSDFVSPSSPVTLTYDFPGTTTQAVTAYSITTANDVSSRDPADWTFEGYNGSQWINLHTVTNWTHFKYPEPASPAQRFFTESFNSEAFNKNSPNSPWEWRFTNTTAYQAYRVKITRNAGFYAGGTQTRLVQLAELQLYLDGRTGDGGGIYSNSRMFLKNGTISGNIAGCLNANCACTAAWCATTSNTAAAMGKGGGVYGGNPSPESFITFMTVAGNSASQGGGAYQDQDDHWAWEWSLFGYNRARAGNVPEPDFHGNPHTNFKPRRTSFFQNTGGINVFADDPNDMFARGLVLTGPERDYVGDPLINALADNGGIAGLPHTWTHALQSGSTAKNKGVSAVGNVITTDQRGSGYPRHNGTYPDLGSYEF